ncbi:hypothetical protein NQ129_08065 [Priestia aryabhattai]|uniref:hypothetical protein n=1 Tax=Priestia aryabhattai TaxID=412384 RepID=UPI00211B92F2|nr:hypothetical protein [Priestia aryabhattai]MCQ9281729.1 hypothetical protein [Priestia aryabhattai]
MDIELTDYENTVLNQYPTKQRERYLMKKFIQWYKIEVNISQRDCHQRLNLWLMENGYKPKRSFTSVHELWHEPFIELEMITRK